MTDSEAIRLLRDAQYAALGEIVERGILTGRAIQRCDWMAVKSADSIFDAVDAYYLSRSARTRLEKGEDS